MNCGMQDKCEGHVVFTIIDGWKMLIDGWEMTRLGCEMTKLGCEMRKDGDRVAKIEW